MRAGGTGLREHGRAETPTDSSEAVAAKTVSKMHQQQWGKSTFLKGSK